MEIDAATVIQLYRQRLADATEATIVAEAHAAELRAQLATARAELDQAQARIARLEGGQDAAAG